MRRTDPVAIPVLSRPLPPTGTREVKIRTASASPGNFATLRNLDLSGGLAPVVARYRDGIAAVEAALPKVLGDEALATGAATIAVACPFCSVMLNDAVTVRGQQAGGDPAATVTDVAALLLQSVKPAN